MNAKLARKYWIVAALGIAALFIPGVSDILPDAARRAVEATKAWVRENAVAFSVVTLLLLALLALKAPALLAIAAFLLFAMLLFSMFSSPSPSPTPGPRPPPQNPDIPPPTPFGPGRIA